MIPAGSTLRTLDPKTLSEADFIALNRLNNILHAEAEPEEPPRSVEETKEDILSIPAFVKFVWWGVFAEGRMVAQAYVSTYEMTSNQHMADGRIEVLPGYRRQGIGKTLLGLIAQEAAKRKRRLLLGHTDSAVQGGEAFMKRLGATAALSVRIGKLETARLDRSLMRRWIAQADGRAGDFKLGLWDGPYPESEYKTILAMKNVMNTAPRDKLEVEDVELTVEQLEQLEASLIQRQVSRWTLYARHKPSGKVAGYTEVFWDARHPRRLDQGDTAVFPEYRNHGLGRWLKAAMMEKILDERPQVEKVYTGNAYSNAAMVKINEEMGFHLHKTLTNWQVEVTRVLAYLPGEAGA